MKYLLLFTLFVSFKSNAQIEVGSSFGGVKLTSITKDVNVLSSVQSGLYVSKDFSLGPTFSLNTQVNINTSTLICDGIFYAENPKRFGITPANSKQSKMEFTTIRVPIYIQALLEGYKETGKYSTISIGPTVEFVLAAKQQAKINGNTVKENASIDRKINLGIGMEMGMYKKISKNKLFKFGYGINYNLTDYLKQNKSFKPLSLIFKIGIAFNKVKK